MKLTGDGNSQYYKIVFPQLSQSYYMIRKHGLEHPLENNENSNISYTTDYHCYRYNTHTNPNDAEDFIELPTAIQYLVTTLQAKPKLQSLGSILGELPEGDHSRIEDILLRILLNHPLLRRLKGWILFGVILKRVFCKS